MPSVYEIVTNSIIEKIEAGDMSWRKAWNLRRMPHNYVSGKPYRGINVLLLFSSRYQSPYWLTYKQATGQGGNVKKGEKSSLAVFWKPQCEEDEKTGKTKVTGAVLRYYRLFNWEQTEGVPEKIPVDQFKNKPLPTCQDLFDGMAHRPEVEYGDPAYSPKREVLYMPGIGEFDSTEEYYASLYHELTHWTGHPSRLDRDGIRGHLDGSISSLRDPRYAKEELIAELGAAYLCNIVGIADKVEDNNAAYLQSWIKVLRENSRMIISAASKSQQAVDFILQDAGYSFKEDDQ